MATFNFDVVLNIVVPAITGGTGGFLYVVNKFKGDLELPAFRRFRTKTVFSLGFLRDVLLGSGAGVIAANVFYAINSMPTVLVASVVAGLAGLAGSKYLFKSKNVTTNLDEEVNRFLDLLCHQNNDEDEDN